MAKSAERARASRVGASPVLPAGPAARYPALDLPIAAPFPPMEATLVNRMPGEGDWLYEPKWDGFRCLAFKDNAKIVLQSKNGQPLGRYFPELVGALLALKTRRLVVDGEIVVPGDGGLDFDTLLQRIHPAETRIRRLASETPALLLVFDLLVDARGRDLTSLPLAERRERLEAWFETIGTSDRVRLSPATRDRARAESWIRELAGSGLDGIVAKLAREPYASGSRQAMQKVKQLRTADCVVGGFRYGQSSRHIGSLLLGLFDEEGRLDHVGFSSSFTADERATLTRIVEPLIHPPGFTGRAPGGPSRWSTERSTEWQPLEPTLVCEVRYDHFSGDRFRHGTKFLRWRPDKSPRQCGFDQVRPRASAAALKRLLDGRSPG